MGARKLFKSLRRNNSVGGKDVASNGGVVEGNSCEKNSSKDTTVLERPKISDASFDSVAINMDSLFKYEEVVSLLSCGLCEKYCGANLVQCRKGHVLCRGCKSEAKITSCKICKQTFVDAPNVVLEKLISMVALPCRFRASGCMEFVFSDQKLEHETFCPYRPITCQYAPKGCSAELPYKDISSHHRQCTYNPRSSVMTSKK